MSEWVCRKCRHAFNDDMLKHTERSLFGYLCPRGCFEFLIPAHVDKVQGLRNRIKELEKENKFLKSLER